MTETKQIDPSSQSVQSHMELLQDIIQRMAANSASCKTWCITLVSAIIVALVGEDKIDYLFISLIPILLFLGLDTYYLSLEYRFRSSYNDFVRLFHAGMLTVENLFVVQPNGGAFKTFLKKLLSPSILPFYSLLVVLIVIARILYKQPSP